MKCKVTLPLLLLLLIAGQLSAEFCRAQCEGMKQSEPGCAMREMAHGHCALCKHSSADSTINTLSTFETCSGQICNGVLGLAVYRSNYEIRPLAEAGSLDVLVPRILDVMPRARFDGARSTRYIPPFDPLISSLRI
jgi:hypothetical protein